MEEILKKHFANFYEKELQEEILTLGKEMLVPTGEVLMDIGKTIKSMPLVVKGLIKIIREDENGNELFLYYLEGGNTCAMSLTCCLQSQKSKIRAVAEEETHLILLPVEKMDEWMVKYKSWKSFVMSSYASRFEELLNTIDLIAFHKMDERLLHYLYEKSNAHRKRVFSITHQEIALELNSSREVISRLLKQLENIGKIKLGRNKIELVYD